MAFFDRRGNCVFERDLRTGGRHGEKEILRGKGGKNAGHLSDLGGL